jgi:hypothetical protein
MSYTFGVYDDILTNLREHTGCDGVYELALTRGFQLASEFESRPFFDALCRDLDHFCGNPSLKVSARLIAVALIFVRYRTALELGLDGRAFHALLDASFYVNGNAARMEAHEQVEVEKAVFLQIRGERLPAAVQLMNLVAFYERTPVPPTVPVPSLRDLALMSALAAPLFGKQLRGFESFLGSALPERTEYVAFLLDQARKSSLRDFGIAAEAHQNSEEISLSFQRFLSEFRPVYNVPQLLGELSSYAGFRLVQSLGNEGGNVELRRVYDLLCWMGEEEVHSIFRIAIQNGFVRGKIDMITGCFRLCE